MGIADVASFDPAYAQPQAASTQQDGDNSALGDNNGQDLTRPEDLSSVALPLSDRAGKRYHDRLRSDRHYGH